MKKLAIFLLLFVLLLSGCGGGKVDSVSLNIGPSQLYGEGDIRDAMNVVVDFFEKNFEHCTLHELSYEEAFSAKFSDEASHYGEDQAIVLKSVFEVDPEGGNGSLEPGSTHYYSWTLTRSGRGDWTLRNWGYA